MKTTRFNKSRLNKSLALTMEMWGLPEVPMSELPEDIFEITIQDNLGYQLVFFSEWKIVWNLYTVDCNIVEEVIAIIEDLDRQFTVDNITYNLFFEVPVDNEGNYSPQLNLTAQGSLNPFLGEEAVNLISAKISEIIMDFEGSLYKEQTLNNPYYFVNIR